MKPKINMWHNLCFLISFSKNKTYFIFFNKFYKSSLSLDSYVTNSLSISICVISFKIASQQINSRFAKYDLMYYHCSTKCYRSSFLCLFVWVRDPLHLGARAFHFLGTPFLTFNFTSQLFQDFSIQLWFHFSIYC